MSFTADVASTEDVLAAIFSATLPALPPQEQQVGNTVVSWWETDPGEVYIHAEGGSPDDRHYAKTLVRTELEQHGYRHAQFDFEEHTASAAPEPPNYRKGTKAKHCGGCKMFDAGICWGYGNKKVETMAVCDSFSKEKVAHTMLRTAAWTDLMAKAKRLIQSGQVQMLRNGFNYIVGHVNGDHGDYDTEISRDDPNSRAITGWQCSCPWDQYAWQRTRKWKKFEGRPCSHTLALYWKALSTPMDEQLTPEQQNALGTGQKLPAPPVEDHAPGREPGMNEAPGHHPEPDGLPRSFGPEGEIIPGDQLPLQGMPPEATGGPPGPAQAPLAPPPGQGGGQGSPSGPVAPGVLPPFPGEQMEMQWAGPGTTPGGGQSPPGAYTVPGAKPPNQPANPLQNPGTYSKIAADFQPPQVVRLKKPMVGLAEGPIKGQNGDGEYREVPEGTHGEVLSQDPSTGWVEALFPLDDTGPGEPFHVRCFLEPQDIEATNQSNAFIRRRTHAILGAMPPKDVGNYITTDDGYTFEVVDIAENPHTGGDYVVRSDLDGHDMARSDGEEGVDWQYVYIPFNEAR